MIAGNNVENIDGYRVVTHVPGNVVETLNQYRIHGCNGVNFLSWHELTSDEIEQISKFEGLRSVNIQSDIRFSLKVLEDIPDLENLSIAKTKGTLDLGRMLRLKQLALDWRAGVIANADVSSIASLSVYKYRPSSGDLCDFPVFPKMENFMLTNSSLESIRGISKNTGLKKISLTNCNKFHDLPLVDLPDLQSLSLENCPKLHDLKNLGSCEKLREIHLHDCVQVDSVKFVKNLTSLKSFRFIGTTVSDGDITPLLGVDDVFFRDSPKYNLTLKDFQARDGRFV